MASLGDVYVGLRLDTTAFSGGISTAQQQAARLGQQLDLFKAPAAAVATNLQAVGEAARTTGAHFEINARVLARFASIGIQELVPSLQGSRLALENLLQPIVRLSGGWAGLALAVGGLIAAVGVATYQLFKPLEIAIDRTATGTRGLAQEIAVLQVKLEGLQKPGFLEQIGNFAQGIFGAGTPRVNRAPTVAETAIDLLFGPSRAQQVERNLAQQGVTRDIGNIRADAMMTLTRAVRDFGVQAYALRQDDPLGKLLEADWQKALILADTINKSLILSPAQRQSLLGEVFTEAGGRRQSITDTFNFTQGAAAATSIGMGPDNILAGLDAIKKLNAETAIYQGNIKRMVEAGISQRDIENEIQMAQTKVDDTLEGLNKRFAETPAILELLKTSFSKLEFGAFAKSLDATAAGFAGVRVSSGGFIEVIDEMVPALAAVDGSLVSVTGDVLALARAFAFAAQQALFLNASVGPSANLGPAAPATE